MITVYILKLETDKYYIGRTTKNVYERVLDHSKGEAGYLAKNYKTKNFSYCKRSWNWWIKSYNKKTLYGKFWNGNKIIVRSFV